MLEEDKYVSKDKQKEGKKLRLDKHPYKKDVELEKVFEAK